MFLSYIGTVDDGLKPPKVQFSFKVAGRIMSSTLELLELDQATTTTSKLKCG